MALAAEIKKARPFEHAEEEAFLNLLRTVSELSAPFDRLFKRHGISEAKYNALRILRGAGGDGLPSLEIAARLVARVPDITRLVDRLEADRLVQRARISVDRRVVLVQITQRGLDLLAKLDKPVTELHRRELRHLTRAELAELNRLLVKARSVPATTDERS
jgi:DNA-binding MarR family transcriptional regulator